MCRSPFLRKNPFQALPAIVLFGGAERDRTADLVNAIHALSQLSYSPKKRSFFTIRLRYSQHVTICVFALCTDTSPQRNSHTFAKWTIIVQTFC